MHTVVDTLQRKGKVEEDLYFAKQDRELLALLHRQRIRSPLGERIVIVSGGQAGVERAALDAALALGLSVSGWCPRGRHAEDGPIAEHYPLLETPLCDDLKLAGLNVRDSDATLILYRGALGDETALIAQLSRRGGRALLMRDLSRGVDVVPIIDWLITNRVRALNCAGARESTAPGIQTLALVYLRALFAAWFERVTPDG